MKNNRASLLLKANQQAIQQRAAQYRAKLPVTGNLAEMAKQNLAALIESEDDELATAAHLMMAYYFPESENEQ